MEATDKVEAQPDGGMSPETDVPMSSSLDRCASALGELAEALTRAEVVVRQEQRLPDQDLDTALGNARSSLEAASAVLHEECRLHGVPWPTGKQGPLGLRELRGTWATLGTTAGSRRRAQQLLDRSARLEQNDYLADPVLDPVRAQIERLRAVLALEGTEASSEVQQFAAEDHPLSVLLTVVERLDDLSDEELSVRRSQLVASYGEHLARLATRGRLRLRHTEVTSVPATSNPFAVEAPDAPKSIEPGLVPPEGPVAPVFASNSAAERAEAPAPPLPADAAQPGAPENTVVADAADHAPPTADALVVMEQADTPKAEAGEFADSTADMPSAGAKVAEAAAAGTLVAGDYDAAWQLLGQDRAGLAWHFTKALESKYPDQPARLQPAVVRVVGLCPLISSPVGEAVDEMRAAVEQLYDLNARTQPLPTPLRQANHVLAVLALIRPSLLASASDARALLATLPLGGALERLRSCVLQFARAGHELNTTVLKGVREHAAWQRAVEAHREGCRQWLVQNRQNRIIYAPTTDVWHHWLRDQGDLATLLQAVLDDQQALAGRMEGEARRWLERNVFDARLASTDRSLRRRAAELRPIEARARRALFKHVQEACVRVQQWCDLLRQRPGGKDEYFHDGADRFRREVQSLLPDVRAEIDSLGPDDASCVLVTTALRMTAMRLLEDLATLFDPEAIEVTPTTSVAEHFGVDLLGAESLSVDAEWRPLVGPGSDLVDVLKGQARVAHVNWIDVFESMCKRRDHLNSSRVIELVKRTTAEEETAEALRSRRLRELEACRSALAARRDAALADLARAAQYDLLPESIYVDLKARLDGLSPDAETVFARADTTLALVQEAINHAKVRRVADVRARLVAESPRLQGPVLARVEQALAEGDFLAANELIDLAVEGRELHEDDREDVLRQFFPDFVKKVPQFMSVVNARDLVSDISRQRDVGPLDMRRVPGAQAAEAGRMLEIWFQLKRWAGRPALKELVRQLFEAFGFERATVRGEEPQGEQRSWTGELSTAPIADREICSIPQFGSLAHGAYRVMCTWERPSEEEIVNSAAARAASNLPLFVLYLGQLTEQRRRDLAVLSRTRRRSLLVIDEAAVLFLCGVRGARMPVLFKCTLPFAMTDPYVTTASLVPPEMFFGRASEQESVFSPYGTNLVFGGRQLGKTALLRHVERRYHQPSEGIIVCWVDLLVERIGVTRTIGDIWPVMTAVLERAGVLRAGGTSQESFKRRVRAWLDEDAKRRVVLLLDEADRFLESDSQEQFANLTLLKGLMDETNRRFKVVFAGLHNVQRTSRDPNAPIGHLNQPLCIGPLLNQKEAREAVAMITKPLGDLGYRFESPNLPMRIVSHTNYYPSLIQIYCKHLLEFLANAGASRFDSRESPPYLVTARHLDEVQDADLRAKILDKFRLTLDLDPRYRVIALLIAHAAVGEAPSRIAVEGVDPAWVREEALFWWAAGFTDKSLEAVKTILDEMQGLGILRKVGGRRYALRSPNLVNLLGTRQDIEDQILDMSSREPGVEYKAASFRRAKDLDPWERSPLTAQQESEVYAQSNGVVVVFGSALAGLHEVRGSLAISAESAHVESVEPWMDGGRFATDLREITKGSEPGLTVVVVPATSPWSTSWVERTLEVLDRKTSRRRFTRVVFLADPRQTWVWTSLDERGRTLVESCVELSLRPWSDSFVAGWMQDTGLAAANEGARARISAATGKWQSPLARFASLCKGASHRWEEHLEAVASNARDWVDPCGIVPETMPVMQVLAQLGEPMSVEMIASLANRDETDVRRVLTWADRLTYVRPEAQDRWGIDPFVAKVVLAVQQQ